MLLITVLQRKAKRAIQLALKLCKSFIRTIRFLTTKSDKRILLNTWMTLDGNGVKRNNWGDDINYWFLRELTDKKIFNYSDLIAWMIPKSENNFLTIGSIIESHCKPNSIIWGSGAMKAQHVLRCKPAKVLAVRGPLTRDLLLSKGIDCPEVYGDPALLLSLHYHPKVEKKYKVGVIPHYMDLQNPLVRKFVSSSDDITLINMENYDDWHDIPDKINECEMILSSSLHGLIISDSYNVPNVWVSFTEGVIGGGEFKFKDYFASVKRDTAKPIKIDSMGDFQKAIQTKNSWKPIHFTNKQMIDSCPLEVNVASSLVGHKSLNDNNVFNGLDLDAPIYKYIPLKYIQTLLKGNLYVGKVKDWDDVYENFFFKQRFLSGKTPIKAESLIECNFGQSWTIAEENDAMWRIYSRISEHQNVKCPFLKCLNSFITTQCQEDSFDNVAIRVKTTARKLFDAVYINDECMATTYIGKVCYYTQDELNKRLLDLKSRNKIAEKMVESLFMKRKEFEHEAETRIIISYSRENLQVKKGNITFKIDSQDFIEELLIDPRLFNTEKAKKIEQLLIEYGAEKEKIKVSQLYSFKPCPTPIVMG